MLSSLLAPWELHNSFLLVNRMSWEVPLYEKKSCLGICFQIFLVHSVFMTLISAALPYQPGFVCLCLKHLRSQTTSTFILSSSLSQDFNMSLGWPQSSHLSASVSQIIKWACSTLLLRTVVIHYTVNLQRPLQGSSHPLCCRVTGRSLRR